MALSPSVSVVLGIMVFLMVGCLAGYLTSYCVPFPKHVREARDTYYWRFICDTTGQCKAQVWEKPEAKVVKEPIDFVLIVRCLVIFPSPFILISIICIIVRYCCYRHGLNAVKTEAILLIFWAVKAFAVTSLVAVLSLLFFQLVIYAIYVSTCSSGLPLVVSIVALVLSSFILLYRLSFNRHTEEYFPLAQVYHEYLLSNVMIRNHGYAMDWTSPRINKKY